MLYDRIYSLDSASKWNLKRLVVNNKVYLLHAKAIKAWSACCGRCRIHAILRKANADSPRLQRQGANFTGEVDNTNLFTSSSDGSFQINTNFANERMTNNGVNRAQQEFDKEMDRRLTEAENKALGDKAHLTGEERIKALKDVGWGMGSDNKAAGSSNRNQILGDIGDGLSNIGQAFGLGNRASGSTGFIDSDGKFHPRTCFTKGTLVTKLKVRYYEEARNGGLTPDARYEEKVAIETIKAGDFVLSFDENTKVKSYKKVTELFHHEVELLYNLELASDEIIETTWNHPFYVVREEANKRSTSLTGGWVEAKDLKAGDKLLNASGNIVQLKSSSQQIQEESISVYNFEVEDNHTYYFGDNGVLVHNYDISWIPSKDGFAISVSEPCRSPKLNRRWYANGKHGVALLTPESNPASKACKGEIRKLFQAASLYF